MFENRELRRIFGPERKRERESERKMENLNFYNEKLPNFTFHLILKRSN
jgi:hypothetical protein